MTTEVVTIDSPTFLDDCKKQYLDYSTEQRLTELKVVHRIGQENAMRMAALVWAANEREDDMLPYRKIVGSMILVYLWVAKGDITIESLRTWGRELKYLDVLKRLSHADQHRLCQGPVPVFERSAVGNTHRLMPLDEIVESGLTQQVFDRGLIRGVAEQEAWLKREERRKTKGPKWEVVGAFEMNDQNEEVNPVSRRPFSFKEIEALYKECKRRGWGKKG